MLSLTLHIVFAAGFGLAVKAAAMQRRDLIVVGAVNYILAGLMAAVWVLARGGADLGWAGGVYGGLNGVVYFVAFLKILYFRIFLRCRHFT